MLTPQSMLLSPDPLEASIEAFAVYAFLRWDAESGRSEATRRIWDGLKCVVSGETVQSIGLKFGINQLRVDVILAELVRLQWIRPLRVGEVSLYVLMDGADGAQTWLIDKAPRNGTDAKEISAKLREQAASRVAEKAVKSILKVEPLKPSLVDSSDDRIASTMPLSKIQDRLVRFYRAEYLRVFERSATFMEIRRQCKNVLDLFRVCDKSVKVSEEYIAFALENWEKARECFDWVGEPAPSMLCQLWVRDMLRDARVRGFRKRVKKSDGLADRAGKSWEEERDGWSS